MNKNRVCAAVFCTAAFLLMTGCSGRSGKEIQFDKSEPLALAPDVSWAVVLDPYAGFRRETAWSAEVVSYCRKGDILQVLGETTVKESGNWYEFKNGWLQESAVTIYNNRLKAETAAARLKD